MKLVKHIFAFLLFAFFFTPLCAQEKDYRPQSKQIFEDIRKGNYARVTAHFDTAVTSKIDSVKLRKVWENLLKVAGPFQSVIETTSDHQPNYDVVIQKAQFEKKKIDFKLVFGTNGKVKGLSFLPGDPKEVYRKPDYFQGEQITERNLVLQNGPFRLPGILTSPKQPGKFPLVILVHGSGPNDKDETVGPTKIFKDIATGLAAKGIAVFRYDKRTRVYAAKLGRDKSLTVKEETVDDAIAAVRFLKSDTVVDSTAIFVAGHSLGAMLLPKIAVIPEVKGIIGLAAHGRPLHEMLYDQTAYVLSLDTSGRDRSHLLDSVRNEVNKISQLKKPLQDTSFYFRIPAGYWADLNEYDHIAAYKSLNLPMLFLHGGRDYQVLEKDFNILQEQLKGKNARFIMYPELNHFFIRGSGKSRPSEYMKAGNVDRKVIDDMAEWINSNRTR